MMECIAFPKSFSDCGHMIRADLAISVSGTLSVREEEAPKVLVNRVEELIENSSFRELPKREEPKRIPQPQMPLSQPKPSPKRLFLRLPERDGRLWKKALNLVEIFDGGFPVAFYDAATAEYDFSIPSVALSEYLLGELKNLLGTENVILK